MQSKKKREKNQQLLPLRRKRPYVGWTKRIVLLCLLTILPELQQAVAAPVDVVKLLVGVDKQLVRGMHAILTDGNSKIEHFQAIVLRNREQTLCAMFRTFLQCCRKCARRLESAKTADNVACVAKPSPNARSKVEK